MNLTLPQLERVATLFRAFGDPTRLAIIQELKSRELGVSEIVKHLPTSQANVSKQLKHLHDAGIINRRKEGVRVIYQIADPMVLELCRIVCEKLNRDTAKPARLKF